MIGIPPTYRAVGPGTHVVELSPEEQDIVNQMAAQLGVMDTDSVIRLALWLMARRFDVRVTPDLFALKIPSYPRGEHPIKERRADGQTEHTRRRLEKM